MVLAVDAGGVYLFGHGLGDRGGHADLHADVVAAARPIDMRCVDTIARYLLYTFIIDFSLEMLDLVHRLYEADESLSALDFMVHTRLYFSQVILQIFHRDAVADRAARADADREDRPKKPAKRSMLRAGCGDAGRASSPCAGTW